MEKYVTLPEVKKMLEDAGKDRELSYEQRTALQHATTFVRLSPTKAKALVKKLVKVERVNDYYACKIADILPREPSEVRAIFMKERYELTEEEIKQIIEAVEGYVD